MIKGVQQIFQEGYAEYERSHAVSKSMRDTAWSVMNCRTAVLGGYQEVCEAGHFEKNHYNSCRNRQCPQCNTAQNEKWLEFQRSRLLDCAHYHVIFTLPHSLNGLWKHNEREMTNLLFQNASATLRELLEDETYLGAEAGWIASLHTWSRDLSLHPHLHVLITAGGLNEERWVEKTGNILLPFRVVRDLFRGKMRASLSEQLESGTLKVPPSATLQGCLNELNRLGRQPWNVKLCPRYEHGQGVLLYLSKYLRGGPVSDRRILSLEHGRVRLKTGRGSEARSVEYGVSTFIQRFLRHVPPKNSIRVRSYGLYSNSARQTSWETANRSLGQNGAARTSSPMKVQRQVSLKLAEKLWSPANCPVCGKTLHVRVLPEIRNPARRKETVPRAERKDAA
ncbi:MAG: transposase [SAR324 cluster bacterium]|nr:transposase [SAR324 cluster bacterium]